MKFVGSIPEAWLRDVISPDDPYYARVREAFDPFLRPGDEVRTFRSDRKSWAHLAGQGGLALIRDGRVVRYIITVMN